MRVRMIAAVEALAVYFWVEQRFSAAFKPRGYAVSAAEENGPHGKMEK